MVTSRTYLKRHSFVLTLIKKRKNNVDQFSNNTYISIQLYKQMPCIKIIDGIKLYIYARDYNPPHFHAKIAEFKS